MAVAGVRGWLVALGLAAGLLAPSVAWAGNSVYSTNSGSSAGSVSTFSIGAGGALTQQGIGVTSGASTSSDPEGVAVSPNGQDLYVTNEGLGTVSTFSIGPGGALTQQGTGVISGSGTKSGPVGVAMSPNGQDLYVANGNPGTVSTFSIASGGALTQQGTGVISGAKSSGPYELAVSPNGQDVYVTNEAGIVTTFSIGPGGALTQQGTGVTSGASTKSDPTGVAVSPNGQDLYVANRGLGTVSTFSIGAGGALTQQGTGVISGASTSSSPEGVAVSPNGQDLHVTNSNAGTVSTFSIGAGGALTQQGTGVTSGANSSSEPEDVVVSPDQGPSAAYAATVAPAGSASVFNAAASSAGSTPIASYVWQFGDGGTASGQLVNHVFATRGPHTVTLALTDTDGCSVFGPFTGQSPFCTTDPAATSSQTITVPAAPPTPTPPSRVAIFGHTGFVSPSGVGGIFLGCFGTRNCVGSLTVKQGTSTIGHRDTETIAPDNGGIVHVTLSSSARNSLTHGHLNVAVSVADTDGPKASATVTLVLFGTATATKTSVQTAHSAATGSSVKVFGHTAFASTGGVAGVFLGCFGTTKCTGSMTVTIGHTTIAHRNSETISPDNGGIVHITLSSTARKLLTEHHTLTINVAVKDTDGQTATGTLTLQQFH